MILPNSLFCLGHIANLRHGPNWLEAQGEKFTLYRFDDEIDYERSTLPRTLVLIEQHGLLWVYREGLTMPEIPVFPVFTDTWPSSLIQYEYNAPFKVVMENLYDLNHVGGTHRTTSLAQELRVENFQARGLEAEYDLVSTLAERAGNWREWLLLKIVRLIYRGEPFTQHVKLLFPGILVFDDSNAKRKGLRSFSIISIYPINDTRTRIVACGIIGTNWLIQKILALLSLKRNQAVFAEDKAILETLYLEYPRKIHLKADTPVDYARELYTEHT